MRVDKTLPFEKAKLLIKEGDVLFFRSRGLLSKIIKTVGYGLYSHVAIASWRGEAYKSILECVEFKEFVGGRTVSLEVVLKSSGATVDVYRPVPEYTYSVFDGQEVKTMNVKYNGLLTTDFMRFITGLPYGWHRIWIMSHRHIPFLRWFVTFVDDDNDGKEYIYPVCSTSLARAFRKTYIDPVPLMADIYVEPSDLSRSLLFNYLFTVGAYEKT